jgi:hypothetical protein
MPCCVKNKCGPFKSHATYLWSAAWPCQPRDNLLLKHECRKTRPIVAKNKKNFIRINIEAIPIYHRKRPQDAAAAAADETNKMEGFELQAVEANPTYPFDCCCTVLNE